MSAPTSAPLVRWNGKEHPPSNRELPPYRRYSKEIFQILRVSSVPAGKNLPKFLNLELLVLDVVFGEDRDRKRKARAPENPNVVRKDDYRSFLLFGG
ncbi:MAG: hypothetical protein LBK83_12085 [Treponema sp.]|jgi:hypothetical protein|nr:hypothetical protein [Treponema sp.]